MKRIQRIGLLFLFILPAMHIQAQVPVDIFSHLRKPGRQGKIEIIQDQAIQSQFNVHLSQQAKLNGIKGYRISIYFGSGQDSKKTAELKRAIS